MSVRIFKNRTFARWALRECIPDSALVRAVAEMEAGLIDARLGSGLCKKRIPVGARGKRGGARVMLAFRASRRAIFLFGFAKNERSTISASEQRALARLARELLSYGDAQIERALRHRAIIEVTDDGSKDS